MVTQLLHATPAGHKLVSPTIAGVRELLKPIIARLRVWAGTLALTMLCTVFLGQDLSSAQAPVPAPSEMVVPPEARNAIALPVRRNSHPGATGQEQWVPGPDGGGFRYANVRHPTLTPFLPADGRGTGAAVIVAPGGGFIHLAIDKAGWNVARWLADHGVAAFVLTYRTRPYAEARRQIGAGAGAAPSAGASPRTAGAGGSAYAPAVEDAEAALRLVRQRAGDWGVDPQRVGMMGFSAGAALALTMGVHSDLDLRPNFIAPIYGSLREIQPPADAPPMFVALAFDDPIFGNSSAFALVEAWRAAGRPVELHMYERGGHGYGVPGVQGTTTVHMMDEFYWWMQARGLLETSSARP